MADDNQLTEDELTAEEILLFGPCVEAQVWTPMWLQESRAPIAVAAGRPKLGRVFDDNGVGKAVVIRPCMSRGRRLRGLPPIYTPNMLEANASVFDGWPMFTDHMPPDVAEALQKRGRSVRELGGQVLKGRWDRTYVHEDDGQYGYRPGAVLAEVWGTPFLRKTVDNNPNLLHTSINAWPKSGKPGPCPWRPEVKGMVIEGIRRQPQGSVDFVVRGGAGGKLLVAEGLEDEGAWPEVGEWSEEDRRLVVSLAESFYASPRMSDVTLPNALPNDPAEMRAWLQEHAPHLLPALQEAAAAANDDDADDASKGKGKRRRSSDSEDGKMGESLTQADVERMIAEASQGVPTVEEFEAHLTERAERMIAERDEQRALASVAHRLIENAKGLPESWKSDLVARYSMLPSGPAPALQVQEGQADDGSTLSARQVLEAAVKRDIDHCLELIAEAQGKPRPTGLGGAKPDSTGDAQQPKRPGTPFWRERFAGLGLAESADKALEVFGGRVTGD